MQWLNTILPSSFMTDDIPIEFNKVGTIRPIHLGRLKVISPVKRRILAKRPKQIEIKRSHEHMALVVPYRNRKEHLEKFIPYISEYLHKQNISFEIIIVEQDEKTPFNRAKLMNIGALQASQETKYFVFHDVDLLPENIDYRYCNHSLKLFTFIKMEDGEYREYKQTNFGGATLVPRDILIDINGFSNSYWQRGSEDDDFLMRHLYKGYVPLYDPEGHFDSLPHPNALTLDTNGKETTSQEVLMQNKKYRQKNRKTLSRFKRGLTDQNEDGINNINGYTIESVTHKELYTEVKVRFLF